MSRIRFAAVALTVAASLGACAQQEDPTVTEPEATEATETDGADDSAGEATLTLADTDLGSIVADAEGRTVYMFMKDEAGESACTDACAEMWPPLEADGDPVAGEGLDEDAIGTIERDDGTTQLTYHDMPLYHYSADTDEGDTKGQGVGGNWYVMGEDGAPIED